MHRDADSGAQRAVYTASQDLTQSVYTTVNRGWPDIHEVLLAAEALGEVELLGRQLDRGHGGAEVRESV
jgi:hypothetical protein